MVPDFEWVDDASGYVTVVHVTPGYYRYIGSNLKIIIPEEFAVKQVHKLLRKMFDAGATAVTGVAVEKGLSQQVCKYVVHGFQRR